MPSALAIEYRDPKGLKPHDCNPRSHPPHQLAQIAQSIDRYGWTTPIIVDETGTVLAGHGRLAVALEKELDEVPTVTLSGLSDEKKREYVLADNKIGENAHWDIERLLAELEFLGAAGVDHEIMGFSDDDLIGYESMIDDVDFAPPPVPEDTRAIVSDTEPTVLQGEGSPSILEEYEASKEEEGNDPGDIEDPFTAPEETLPDGKVMLTVPLFPFQRDRILEVLKLVMQVEEVDNETDALFLMAELYAEENNAE